jgi:hypothetical protein
MTVHAPREKVAISLFMFFSLLYFGAPCLASTSEVPLNFDSQLIGIFEVAQTANAVSEQHGVSPEDRKVLARILDKFRKHKMMLKNAVYRTDMGVIRITWADDSNIDIVKVAYKTSKDPVLGNSIYADKRQVVDVKISYRTASNSYHYLRLQSMDNIRSTYVIGDTPLPPPEKPAFDYKIEGKLTNEECRFCHILAQNDGSPSGVFFPRYQETYKQTPINPQSLFRAEHFTLTAARLAESLGLPKMKEDFLYQKVDVSLPDVQDENKHFARTLIELPQLIEVMARDNNKSMCVAVDFGGFMERMGFGRSGARRTRSARGCVHQSNGMRQHGLLASDAG